MKQKTKLSLLLVVILSLLCLLSSGCKKNFTYPFLYDISQITEIKIGVKNQEYIDSESIIDKYTIKAVIIEKEEFIEDFAALKFNYNFPGDPITIKANSYAIIIIYDNGCSEEVHWGAQCKKQGGEETSGIVHCDEKAFNNLLLKWYPDM